MCLGKKWLNSSFGTKLTNVINRVVQIECNIHTKSTLKCQALGFSLLD